MKPDAGKFVPYLGGLNLTKEERARVEKLFEGHDIPPVRDKEAETATMKQYEEAQTFLADWLVRVKERQAKTKAKKAKKRKSK